MTRTVTLADLAGARPCATATSTSQDAASAGNEGGSSFAHILEGAGAARHGHDEVEDKDERPGTRERRDLASAVSQGSSQPAVELTATLTSGTDPGPAVSAGTDGPSVSARPTASSSASARAGESTDLGLKMGPGAGSGAEEQLSHSLGTGPTATADRDSSSAGTEPTAAADRDSPSAGTELRTPGTLAETIRASQSQGQLLAPPSDTKRLGAGTPLSPWGESDRATAARPERKGSLESLPTSAKEAGEQTGGGAGASRFVATATGAVPAEQVTVASVKTSFGEFAAHLEKSGPSEPPLQSDFVASNSVLSAALSKPVNEGSGVYSVTAMLNPPSLGRVQAVVRVDGGDVNVSIVAHSPEGHLAISGHLDELRQVLATSGGDVQLSLADGGGKGRQHQEAEGTTAGDDSEGTDTIVLTPVPEQSAGKSLHIIL